MIELQSRDSDFPAQARAIERRYYAAMLRDEPAQHCKRLRRDQQRFPPLEEAGPC